MKSVSIFWSSALEKYVLEEKNERWEYAFTCTPERLGLFLFGYYVVGWDVRFERGK